MRGRFITFEGIDGAGKSSHLHEVETWLAARDIPVVTTREPGGTPAGEAIRAILLDRKAELHPETETLLMFAARREHIDRVILPALDAGRWVLCDRFTDATLAYQGGGRGVERSRIESLADWVQQGLKPDLTILFDVPVDVAQQRARNRTTLDRFESEAEAFHGRVRNVYRQLAAEYPMRIRTIDASKTSDEVKRTLQICISNYMNNIR